jgi:hypothetical protein
MYSPLGAQGVTDGTGTGNYEPILHVPRHMLTNCNHSASKPHDTGNLWLGHRFRSLHHCSLARLFPICLECPVDGPQPTPLLPS